MKWTDRPSSPYFFRSRSICIGLFNPYLVNHSPILFSSHKWCLGRTSSSCNWTAWKLEFGFPNVNYITMRKHWTFNCNNYGRLLPKKDESPSTGTFIIEQYYDSFKKIYSLLMIGFAAQLLLYFFWDTTVNDVSVPFFILFFASSLVDCTSSGICCHICR